MFEYFFTGIRPLPPFLIYINPVGNTETMKKTDVQHLVKEETDLHSYT